MNAMAVSNIRMHARARIEESPLALTRRRWTAGLVVIGALGTLFVIAGLLISAEALTGLAGGTLSALGTILIAAAFPSFFAAAHCLDKADEARKAMRLEYLRDHGFRDEDR